MAWRGPLFQKVFSRYLLLTNTAVSGVLDGLGDYMQQGIFERAATNDWGRTRRMAAMGFMLGPLDHYWYRMLDRRLPMKTAKVIAIKVLLDELVMGTFTIAVFFTGQLAGLLVTCFSLSLSLSLIFSSFPSLLVPPPPSLLLLFFVHFLYFALHSTSSFS